MPDGLVRGLPKRPAVEGLGVPKILSIRNAKTSFNVAFSGTVTNTPKLDSLWIASFTNTDNNQPAYHYQEQFGGVRFHPIAYYGNGVVATIVMMGRVIPGTTPTLTTSYNFGSPSTAFRSMVMYECEVENVRGIVRRTTAHAPSATSVTCTGWRYSEAPGSIAVASTGFDDGGAGISGYDTVTMDEEVAGSVGGALGGLVIGNNIGNDGSSWTTRFTSSRSDNWSGVTACIE